MAKAHATLTQLAQQAAAQIGFLPRRWWREKTDPQVLRVEVERRLVGAPSAIAVLTVNLPHLLPTPPIQPKPTLPTSRSRSAPHTRERTRKRRAARPRTS